MMSSASASRQVVTEKVVLNGKHGPYAVGRDEKLGVITFSLEPPVWQESEYPEKGTIVEVSDIQKKKAGWRAKSARYVRPV